MHNVQNIVAIPSEINTAYYPPNENQLSLSMNKQGQRDAYVKELQTLLNELGSSLVVDGVFGQNTKNAVMSFQENHSLIADGEVGTNTIYALSHSISKSPHPCPGDGKS